MAWEVAAEVVVEAGAETAATVVAEGVAEGAAGTGASFISEAALTKAAAGFIINQAIGALFGGGAKGSTAAFDQAARGVMINHVSNVDPIPILYGTRRVGGSRVLVELSGDGNQFLNVVIVWGEGPISAVQQLYLDDVPITDTRFVGLVGYTHFLGSDTQAASAQLIAAIGDTAKWNSSCTLSGLAYTYLQLSWDSKAFPTGLPNITADIDGRTLYDPRDASTKFSHNPALVIRDYLTNARYGRGVASAMIDDTALGDAATHCEERLTGTTTSVVFTAADFVNDVCVFPDSGCPFWYGDGVQVAAAPGSVLPGNLAAATTYYAMPWMGGVRLATSMANAAAGICIDITDTGAGTLTMTLVDSPRYTCDGLVSIDQSPFNNLGGLLTSCRGYLVFSGGQYRLRNDKATTTSSFALTEDNIVGAWQFALGTKRNRFNRVKAMFMDPARSWQSNYTVQGSAVYLAADNALTLEGQVQLPYTANWARAAQSAQIELKQSRFGIVVSLVATIAATACEVGDVIPVTHSTPGWTAKLFRVIEIELLNSDEVRLVLREYDASVYTLDAIATPGPVAEANLPDPFDAGEPVGLVLASGTTELLINGDGTVISRIKASWTSPMDIFVTSGGSIEIQSKKSADSVWVASAPVDGAATSAWVSPVEDGVAYDVRIRGVNSMGVPSDWVTQSSYTVIGKTALPTDITYFTIEGNNLSWSTVSDADLLGYRLRFQPGTLRSWGDAIWLHGSGTTQDVVTNSPFTMQVVPSGPVTLMVKAVDTSGNESQNAAYIVTDLGDALVANVVETYDIKAAGFPSTKTSCAVSGGNLVADVVASPLKWRADDQSDMWAADPATLMWDSAATQYAAMTYVDTLSVIAALAGSQLTIQSAIAGSPWTIEYRENSAKLMWGADSSALMWNASGATLMWDQPVWLPWPGSVTVQNSIYDFRVSVGAGTTRGTVSQLTLTVDAPDLGESVNNVVIGAGGTRLTLTKSFTSIKNVQLTVQNDGGTAITARTEDKLVTGPLIKCLDAAGVATTGLVDARVQGY